MTETGVQTLRKNGKDGCSTDTVNAIKQRAPHRSLWLVGGRRTALSPFSLFAQRLQVGAFCLVAAGCLTSQTARPKRVADDSSYREFVALMRAKGIHYSTDRDLIAPVNRVSQRILEAAHGVYYGERARQVRWDIGLMEAPEVANAVAFPSGQIIVFSGLFPVASTESGLAAIIGHEVAHILRQHTKQRREVQQDQEMAAMVLGTILGAGTALATGNRELGSVVSDTSRKVAEYHSFVNVLLPFGRQQEMQADRIGVELAAQAGYDPIVAITVWERLSEESAGPARSMLATHPPAAERLKALRSEAAEASIGYRSKAPGSEDPLPRLAD